MFSEGIDYPIYDIFGSQAATSILTERKMPSPPRREATSASFAVDPRGLVGMTSEAIELNAAADAHLGFDAKGSSGRHVSLAGQPAHARRRDGRLCGRELQQPQHSLNRIVRLNSTYYVLGYYPKDARRDGRFHKIEVRIKRPGLRVSARKGYVSPRIVERRGTGAAGARARPWPRTRRLDADVE